MKLRKKQIEVPKIFFIPPWRISVCYRGIFDFLGGVGSEESKSVGGIGRVTSVGTHESVSWEGVLSRTARRVTVVGTLGRASVPVKNPDAVTFDTTDARPCVPTTVTRLALTQRTHDRASLQPLLVLL